MRTSRRTHVALMAKRSILAGLALLLVSLVQPCQAGTFFDDFNDGNANGWELLPGARQLPALWSVQNGMLVQGGTDDYITGLVEDLVFSGQSIEVQVQSSGYAGVILWYQDSGNYLSVGINPFSAGVYISEMVDGQQLSPYWRYEYGTRSGDIYHLRVDADSANGHLAIYLNDAHVFTYDSSTPNRTGLSGVMGGNNTGYFDNFRVTSDIPAIDIVPGSTENRINRKKPGTVSVAVLSAANFDAPAQVNRTSLTFGPTGDEAPVTSCSKKARDVNGDGYPDLICSFSISAAGFQADDTEGVLKGMTTGGISFVSSDMVNIR